jgi:DNA anti-recombination protein RmuC
MTNSLKSLVFLFLLLPVFSITATAQNGSDTPTDRVANQLGMLRQSVQTLDATLSDISDKFLPLYAKAREAEAQSATRISANFALLTQAEQRAEILRKQLIELIEKETAYRSRIAQLDEDMRPDNIERSLNPYGTTRTAELRESRRRVLESDRRGLESLLMLTSQARLRLEDDVRQADALVARLKQRLMPVINDQIDKINPDKP